MNANTQPLRHAFAAMAHDVPAMREPYVGDGRLWLREVRDLSARMVREHYQPSNDEVTDFMEWCNDIRSHAGLDPIAEATA